MRGTMSTESAGKQVVARYFDVIAGRRTDLRLEDFFTADARWHVPFSNPLIKPNPKCGIAGVMDVLGSGVALYREGSLDIGIESLIGDGTDVAAQFTFHATLANGAPYENRYFFRFRLEGERIAEVWEYLDTLHQQQQGVFAPG
jgi:ketosteroid isomerase-like protein